MARPYPLDYARPMPHARNWRGVASTAAGCIALLIDLPLWTGVFAHAGLELVAAYLALLIPIAGLIFAIGAQRSRLRWIGVLTSTLAEGVYVAFVMRLPLH